MQNEKSAMRELMGPGRISFCKPAIQPCPSCEIVSPVRGGRKMKILSLHFDSGQKNAGSVGGVEIEISYCPNCGRFLD